MKPFSLEGYFRWPDEPDKEYIGFLEFDPKEGGWLRIAHGDVVDRTIENSKERVYKANEFLRRLKDSKIILGRIVNTEYTLLDCHSGFTLPGGVSTKIYVRKIIKGLSFQSENEICFGNIYLSIPILEYWVRKDIISENGMHTYYKGEKGIDLKLEPKESEECNINENFQIQFTISADINLSREESIVRKRPYFILKYDPKENIQEIEKNYYHLLNLIAFTSSKPLYFKRILIHDSDEYDNHEIFFERKYSPKDVDGKFTVMLFSYEDIREIGFEYALKNWFSDYEQMKHIYEMFFLTIYTKQTLAFNFLSLAQALDSYTNIYVKNLLETNKITKKYKKYEDRILLLLDSFSDIFKEIKLMNFAKAIVETRHAISHGDSKEEKEQNPFCYEDNDLYMLFFGAKMILSAVFLRKIGFGDKKIYDSLKNNGRFGNIVVGKYKFEEKGIDKIK